MLFKTLESAILDPDNATEIHCVFNGKKLPREIGRLVNLERLRLDGARELGALPKEIGELRSLKHLEVNAEKLKTLPDEIGALDTLETLVWRGKRGASLPASLGQLRNLRELTISAGLSVIEAEVLPSGLESLTLSYNKLAELPASIGQLKALQTLDASYNKLASLPGSLSELSELRELNLNWNKLGPLPAGTERLSHLRVLGIAGSKKIKKLPAGFPALEELSAAETGLAALPESLTECAGLRRIDLRECRLASLPDAIGKLENLQALWVDNNWQHADRNQLTAVPAALFTLPNLVLLDLRFNPIPKLPPELGALPRLGFLGLPDDERMPAEEANRAAAAYPNAYIARGAIDWSEIEKMPPDVQSLLQQ